MLKKTSDIYDLLNIKNEKKDFDQDVESLIKIIGEECGVVLKKSDLLIKKDIVKIKTSSNNKFVMLLNINKINIAINQVFEKKLTLEL